MRPPKLILVFSGDDCELSTIAFMLQTNLFRVLKAGTADRAMELFQGKIDLVLLDVGFHWFTSDDLAKRMKELRKEIPIIMLGDNSGFIHSADALLSKATTSNSELLERIHIMSQRKRGPRPHRSLQLVKVA